MERGVCVHTEVFKGSLVGVHLHLWSDASVFGARRRRLCSFWWKRVRVLCSVPVYAWLSALIIIPLLLINSKKKEKKRGR